MTSHVKKQFCTMSDLVDRGLRPARYGLPWTENEFKALRRHFAEGYSLVRICNEMERPASGVATKLHHLKLVDYDSTSGRYYYPLKKETIMANEDNSCAKTSTPAKAPNIEVKVFIGGEDAARMSDEQIFNKIASLEDQITKASRILTRPKKLDKLVESIQADINKLVEFVDARP